MWEQRFVVHQPQRVIVCAGSGMAEGKTPAGMNSSAAVSAGMLSKTDNVTFQYSVLPLQRYSAHEQNTQCVGLVTGGSQ